MKYKVQIISINIYEYFKIYFPLIGSHNIHKFTMYILILTQHLIHNESLAETILL